MKASTATRLIALLALACALATPALSSAQSTCQQFDFTKPWTALQGNGHRVQFTLYQQQPTVAGFAESCDAQRVCTRGRVSGEVLGGRISLSTGWGGEYSGRVQADGRLLGNTFDGNDIRAQTAVWSSNRKMACLVDNAAPVGSNDFNSDGSGDVVWHNDATHETQIWFMRGNERIGRSTVVDASGPTHVGPPWHIVGSGDFNRDRKSDLLWYNDQTGETQLWFLDGARLADRATVVDERGNPFLVGDPWRIVGSQDMNGDGQPDIAWYNRLTGTIQVWLMDRHRVTRRVAVTAEDDGTLTLGVPPVAMHDMNADGLPDILVRTGETVQILLMKGLRVERRRTVRASDGSLMKIGSSWTITGANDFDRDGYGDIISHDASSGETRQWVMHAEAVVQTRPVDARLDGGGARVGLPWRQIKQ
jgi:FG-GAP-like repeat